MTDQPPDTGQPEVGPVTVAVGRQGQSALRRRGTVLELVVNGVFAMDSAHSTTEAQLAHLALARLRAAEPQGSGPLHILVGGLGLGYTAQAVLTDSRVDLLTVVEFDPDVVQWAVDGLMPVASQAVADERCRLLVAAVQDVVPAVAPDSLDAILLDVDNGPGFLVHEANAVVYGSDFLGDCVRALRPGAGVLAVWSAEASDELAQAVRQACGVVEEVLLPVSRDGRHFSYAVYLGVRTALP